MSRIKLLPAEVHNQIAAGEVIERPASVVKELLENCADAHASHINIDIEGAGITRIRISDNGDGIVKEDLQLAITCHATSKINQLQDLYLNSTLGFRGEALSSIASVAKITITSKPDLQDYAYELIHEHNESKLLPASRSKGTTIEIRDLFYNAPVRREFLKSEKTEYQIIESLIKRFALSHPEIAINLSCNGKKVFCLPKCDVNKNSTIRIQKIFGASFLADAVFIKAELEDVGLQGFISNANYQRSQNDKQYFYINQRMVKDKLIQHAINKAYEDVLYPGRFASYVLYLTIPPSLIDVNVHPTKQEVRFKNPRLVHDLISSSILKILGGSELNLNANRQIPTSNSNYTYVDLKTNETKFYETELNLNIESSIRKWSILNAKFAIIFINNQSLLIDVIKYMQSNFLGRVENNSALPGRNFLVPIRFAVNQKIKNKVTQLINWFKELGIIIDFISETHVLIRTICKDLEEVDFNLCFKKLMQVPIKSKSELANILFDSQNLNLMLLDKEEKEELFDKIYKHLEISGLQTPFSIILNEDICCNLIRQKKSYA